MSARQSRMRGQTLIVFALGFALFLFAVTCLVADTAFLFRWSGAVQAAAQLAAESGADAVDPRYLYAPAAPCAAAGTCATIVDVTPQDRRGSLYAFQLACIQAGDQSADIERDPPGDASPKTPNDPQAPDGTACRSNGCSVSAVVTRDVSLPIPVPGLPATFQVRGAAYAAPVVGTARPQATCSGGVWVP